MIATGESLNGQSSNRGILKKFDEQIKRIRGKHPVLLGGMKRKEFDCQANRLRQKLEVITETPNGNILIVTCLPFGSLAMRMRRISCDRHAGVCDCNLATLETKYPPKTLYALVGVNDGRERRLQSNGNAEIDWRIINDQVKPHHPLTAWAGIDLALLYPNVLRQHGLIFGHTAIRNAATALWIYRGQPTFGSTGGKRFKRCSGFRFGIPSYQTLVTP